MSNFGTHFIGRILGFLGGAAAILLISGTNAFAEATQANGNNYPSYVLNLVNQDRASQGSAQVEENAKLDRVAQAYAEYLLRSGFFGHVDPFGRSPQDRAGLYGINVGVSENLAFESSNFESPPALLQRAESSMMNEPRNQMNHRYNILNPQSRYIGIGVARGGDKILIVQEFTSEQP